MTKIMRTERRRGAASSWLGRSKGNRSIRNLWRCCIAALALSGWICIVVVDAVPAVAIELVEAPNDGVLAFEAADPVAPMARGVDEDLQFRTLRKQLEPFVQVELSFARRVCGLTDEQLAAASIAFGACLDATTQEFARKKGVRRRGIVADVLREFIGGNAGVNQQRPRSPIERLRSTLPQSLEPLLNEEQKTPYRTELEARETFRRETIVDNLLTALGDRLALTPQQHAEIRQALLARWDEKWVPPLYAFPQMSNYIPEIPDDSVTPFLTPTQRPIYQNIQKISWGVDAWQNDLQFSTVGQHSLAIDDVQVAEAKTLPTQESPTEEQSIP